MYSSSHVTNSLWSHWHRLRRSWCVPMNLLFMNCCLEHHEYTVLMSIHILNIPLHRNASIVQIGETSTMMKIRRSKKEQVHLSVQLCSADWIGQSKIRFEKAYVLEMRIGAASLGTKILKGLQEMDIHDMSYDLLYFICKKNLSFYFLSSPVLFVYILSTQGKRLWSSSMVENWDENRALNDGKWTGPKSCGKQ